MSAPKQSHPVTIHRSRKAWIIYIVVSLLLLGLYGRALYPDADDPQAAWNREAEWLGPAQALAVRYNERSTAYLLQMEESAVEELASRLGCRELEENEDTAPHDDWHSEFSMQRLEVQAYCNVKVGKLGRKLVTDDYFYQSDPEDEARHAGETQTETLRRHRNAARLYGIARVEGDSPGNILLCEWEGPYNVGTEDRPTPKPIQPAFPQYHEGSLLPDWMYITLVALVILLFLGGINYICNGLLSLLGGPFGWWRITLWFLLPVVCWVVYQCLLAVKLTFQFIDGGLPGMFLGGLTIVFIAISTLLFSSLVSTVWFFLARHKRK